MMRRKIQTIGWLTALLTLTLLWVSPALAVDYKFEIAGVRVTDANCNNLSKLPGVTVAPGGWFTYDPASNRLDMKDVTVSPASEKIAILNFHKGLKIVIAGSNYLKVTDATALSCIAPTEIKGDGYLFIERSRIYSSIFVNGATLTISGISLESGDIRGTKEGNQSLIFKNARVKIKVHPPVDAILDFNSFTTQDCEIISPKGAYFDATKRAVRDADGELANEIVIERNKYDLYIAGTQVTKDNCNDLSKIPGVTAGEGSVFRYNPVTTTLTMKGITVSAEGKYENAILNENIHGLKIKVEGTNSLKSSNGYSALVCDVATEICGYGTCTMSATEYGGIYTRSTLTITNSTIVASGKWGIMGMNGTKEKLILKNAKVTATGTEAGIISLASLEIEEGKIITPANGKFDEKKHAVVDDSGNKAKEVEIIPVYSLYIGDTQVTYLNCNDLSGLPGVTVADGGEFKYAPKTKRLIMKNVTVSTEGNAILIGEELEIVVSGTNRVESKNWLAINLFAHTEIYGNGSLTVTSINNTAIRLVYKNLTISNITFEATGSNCGIEGMGIGEPKEVLTIKRANVIVKGAKGIRDIASIITESCEIVTPANGKFDDTKHAVVDAEGNVAKEVKIERTTYDLYIAGTQVTKYNCNDLSKIPGVTVDKGSEFKYEPSTTTLTMKDIKVSTESGINAIVNENIHGLKIEVEGTNSLKASYNKTAALTCKVSTEIKGSGSLTTISSDNAAIFIHNPLTISDITLEVSGKWGIAGLDGTSNEKLTLKNAKVTATGTEAGIADLASFTTEGCKIVEPAGGNFNETEHAVVDTEGNVAKEVKIERTVPVTGVTVTPKTVDLTVGKTQQLTISVQPATATNQRYTCQSDNESVATVTNTGLITAVSVGTATITVTTEDGNKTETCKVTVSQSTSPDVPDGVEDALFAKLSVAPNPFSSQLQIAHGELQGTYALLNSQGVVVLSGELGEAHTYLSTASLPAGVYLLRFTATNGATKTFTVVKR